MFFFVFKETRSYGNLLNRNRFIDIKCCLLWSLLISLSIKYFRNASRYWLLTMNTPCSSRQAGTRKRRGQRPQTSSITLKGLRYSTRLCWNDVMGIPLKFKKEKQSQKITRKPLSKTTTIKSVLLFNYLKVLSNNPCNEFPILSLYTKKRSACSWAWRMKIINTPDNCI